MGFGKFQPLHKIDTSEPIDKKFGTVDYAGEGNPYTHPLGASGQTRAM